ncbi:MAG: hypothetical protein HY788_06235 [Deltaproteobacteria bacterium]|nr:hypothetical protein [Deltaproteobacteria bacterium]
MSSDHKDFWYRKLFRLKIHEASGTEFQRLFNDVMQYSTQGFQAVAPWGNWGDGGNDGWCPRENRYFQVFGPQAATTRSPVQAVNKTIIDFNKLRKKWPTIERYHFVYNDRFRGAPAPIASSLLNLAIDENLKEATPISSAELEAKFMSLTESQKMMIVGGIPAETPEFIDPSAIGELLTYLADNPPQIVPLLDDTSPDFHKKIQLNGITVPVSEYLRIYSYQVDEIDVFLKVRDPGLAQQIALQINELYHRSKTAVVDSADAPNERYVWLVESLIPTSKRNHPHSLAACRLAAQVIISKYFETCDAYEHPDSIDPA